MFASYVLPDRRLLPPQPRHLIACRVRVRTQAGQTYCYHALVPDTCSAVHDALDYFGHCHVSVMRSALPSVAHRSGSLS